MALRDKNAHYRFDELTAERWRRQAERSGVPSLWDAMRALVSELDAALTRVEARLPRGFPLALWRSIAEGALRQARAFLRDA